MRLLICVSLCVAGCGADALLQQVGTLSNAKLDEVSGIARSGQDRNLLWVINDDGPATLQGIGYDGQYLGKVRISGARNTDWEDLAAFSHDGMNYVVVADIGDNEARRDHVTLYVVQEPAIADQEVAIAWSVNFTYPDGPRDAESLAVDAMGEQFYVLSKRDVPAVLYVLPLRPGDETTLIATRLATIDSLPQPDERQRKDAASSGWGWQPTAMDFAADGRSALILTYAGVYFYPRAAGQSWSEALRSTAMQLRLGKIRQAEAIGFDFGGLAAYLTVEKEHAPLFRVDLSSQLMLQENDSQ